jgi:hypothetical protein
MALQQGVDHPWNLFEDGRIGAVFSRFFDCGQNMPLKIGKTREHLRAAEVDAGNDPFEQTRPVCLLAVICLSQA